MNYDMDLLIWDRIHIDVVDIRRGLLEQTRTDVVPENNVYLFVIGRSGTIFIDGVPYISDLQKEFYKRYIEARLDVLLRPVFEMTELTETEQTGPTISL